MKLLTARQIQEKARALGQQITSKQVRVWMARNGFEPTPGQDQRRSNQYSAEAVEAFLSRDTNVGAGNANHPHSNPTRFKQAVASRRRGHGSGEAQDTLP